MVGGVKGLSPRSEPGEDWGVRVVEFEEVELELSGPVFETLLVELVNWLLVDSDLVLVVVPEPVSF